jgi:hypothetical protein
MKMIKVPCEPQAGADVELFVANKDDEGIIPCVGLIEGTKEKPFRPPAMPEGYTLQEDNVMLEFNIPPVTEGYMGREVVAYARKMVVRALEPLNLKPMWHVPVWKFKPEQLTSKQAQIIGCEVDYDAYTGGTARTNTPALTEFRSCGGHIHLGGDFKCPDFVAALFAELFLSVLGMGIVSQPGIGDARTKWYGMPGVFRPKPYGIEYRTPNNNWAMDNGNAEWALGQAVNCANYLTRTPGIDLQRAYRGIPWTKAREFLIHGNKDLRTELLVAARELGVPV